MVEEFLAACSDRLTTDEYVQLKHREWQGKRVKITITEHQPTQQDYLNAAIREGMLRATPDAEYPYTWNLSEVTKEWVSEFVVRVCHRLGIAQPWRWAHDLFGLSNLRQYNNRLSKTSHSESISKQVIQFLNNIKN